MEISFQTDAGETVSITVDATLAEQHEDAALVTERAVETGAPVSDHVRAEPARIRIEAHVTNTPVRAPETLLDGATLDFQSHELEARVYNGPLLPVPVSIGRGAATISISALLLSASQPFDRVRAVYEALLKLQQTGTVVRVITSLREYDDMVLRNISVPRSADDGSAITITFDAQQVRFANTEIVDVPEPSESRGRPTVNRGRQETEPAEVDNRSAAARGVDTVAGWFGL